MRRNQRGFANICNICKETVWHPVQVRAVSVELKQLTSASRWQYPMCGHTALTGNCRRAVTGWWCPSFFTLALQLVVTHLRKHKARNIVRLEIWAKLWCHKISVALDQGPDKLIEARSGNPFSFHLDQKLAQRVAVLHSKGQAWLSATMCLLQVFLQWKLQYKAQSSRVGLYICRSLLR